MGAQLRQPGDTARAFNWPPPSVWAVALGLFHQARERRHAKADAAQFFCSVCGKRWALLGGLTRHDCLGARASAIYHTPSAQRRRASTLRRRARGGGGGGGGGAENALVELSEDDDGPAESDKDD